MNSDFRRNAPPPLAARDFNLPTPFETKLANGLKIVIVEDRRLPIVSFRLAFRTGSAVEPPDLTGLTGMVTMLLNEGTVSRSSQQIAAQIERLGASVSASAGLDSTVVAASTLTMFSSEVLDLLADLVLNPVFPDDELHLARDNAKQNLIAQRAQPGFLSDEQFSKALYGEHPYSVVSPTIESLDRMTRETLTAYHRQIFIPNTAVFVVVGDVDAGRLAQKLEFLFGAWQPGSEVKLDFPAPPTRTETEIYLVDRAGSAQTNIVLGNLAAERSNPDYFSLLMANQVLGAGASSRLFMNLREEKDFTYGAYSGFDSRRLTGNFEATAEVRSDATGASLKEFFYELRRIRDEEVPAAELEDARNYITGVFPLRLETQEGLISQLVSMQMFDLPADYLQTYREKINQVTAADVQRVAQKYITPDKTAIVIVGDENTVYDQIQLYAEKINLFDSQGNKKERNKMGNETATDRWNLTLSSPQGDLPVTMTLNTDGGNLSGTLTTPIGDGTISGGTYNETTLNTSVSISFQGMPVNATIEGSIDNDSISGSVATGMLGSLAFTGTRAV